MIPKSLLSTGIGMIFLLLMIAVVAVYSIFSLLQSLLGFSKQSSGKGRHRHYQKKAARALTRLPQLRDDAARMVWLRKMNPYVFEEMLLTALARQGLRIRRNTTYSGDGGVDGQVWINGHRWLIQAKRYGATISAAHVSALGQLAEKEGCRGLFIHTGRTGDVSRDTFRCYPGLSLVSGQTLLMLLSGDRRWMRCIPDNRSII